jgi:hypothetical protein
MVEKKFFNLGHTRTDDFDSLISDLILAHDESFDVGKKTNGFDINVSNVRFGKVNLLSLRCNESVFDSDFLGNLIDVVLGQLFLELLELFLGNGKSTLRYLFFYLRKVFCYLI